MSNILNEYLNKDCIITVSGTGMAFGSGGEDAVSGKIIDIDEDYIKVQTNKGIFSLSSLGHVKKGQIIIINKRYIVAING